MQLNWRPPPVHLKWTMFAWGSSPQLRLRVRGKDDKLRKNRRNKIKMIQKDTRRATWGSAWRRSPDESEGSSRVERSRGAEVSCHSASQGSWLTLGSVRPSVKGSHAKWMATGCKRVLHFKEEPLGSKHTSKPLRPGPLSLSLWVFSLQSLMLDFSWRVRLFFCLFL